MLLSATLKCELLRDLEQRGPRAQDLRQLHPRGVEGLAEGEIHGARQRPSRVHAVRRAERRGPVEAKNLPIREEKTFDDGAVYSA